MTFARMISQMMQQRFRRFGHGTWNLRNLFGNQRNNRNGQAPGSRQSPRPSGLQPRAQGGQAPAPTCGIGPGGYRQEDRPHPAVGTRPPTNLALGAGRLPRVGSASGVREAIPHAHGQVGGPSKDKQVDRSHPVSGARPPTNCGGHRGKWQLGRGHAPPPTCPLGIVGAHSHRLAESVHLAIRKRIGKLVGGQALVELAVFGSILLAAPGLRLRVGMKMNYDQEIRMAAFRRALAAAHADNGTDQDAMAVLYYYMSDRQMPDPGDGIMSLPRARAESTAFVEWGDRLTYAAGHLRATQPLVAVRLNGTEQEFRMEDLPHHGLTYQDDGNVVVGQVAFRSLAREAETTNVSSGTLAQSGGGSSTGSTTTTNSWGDVNTVSGDRVSSSLTSGASGLGP